MSESTTINTHARVALMLREAFAALGELERTAPYDADALYGAVIAHVRARRPEAVAPLGTLPPPTEPNVDPRSSRP